jgi:hypothetical protein
MCEQTTQNMCAPPTGLHEHVVTVKTAIAHYQHTWSYETQHAESIDAFTDMVCHGQR